MDLNDGLIQTIFNPNTVYNGMELHSIFNQNKEIKAQFNQRESYCGWLIAEIVRIYNIQKRSDIDSPAKDILLSRVRCFRFTNEDSVEYRFLSCCKNPTLRRQWRDKLQKYNKGSKMRFNSYLDGRILEYIYSK